MERIPPSSISISNSGTVLPAMFPRTTVLLPISVIQRWPTAYAAEDEVLVAAAAARRVERRQVDQVADGGAGAVEAADGVAGGAAAGAEDEHVAARAADEHVGPGAAVEAVGAPAAA